MTSSEESAGGTRRFKLVKLLGQGSAGTIWLAFDPREQRLVALKLLSDDAALRSPNARERFWREVRILKDVRHPNLVRFYGHGTVEDRPYFAMEYVRGQSLQDRLAQGTVGVFTALRAVYGVARGLDYVHRLGIVHRDVKPSNILIEEDKDGRGTPRLVDFGLARCRAERDLSITGSGVAVGTPRYASPEQARGSSRDADARSDVYSLGLVLASAITHAPPPAPRELDDFRTRFERDILPDLARRAPAAVVDVCRTACAYDPRLRYPTARELAREIRGILRESSQRLRCA